MCARRLLSCRVLLVQTSLLNDFDVPWPSAVENLWSVSGSASTVPVSASFVTCTMQMSYFARFWMVVTAPLTSAVLLLIMPAYYFWRSGRGSSRGDRDAEANARRTAHWGRWRTGVLVVSYLL